MIDVLQGDCVQVLARLKAEGVRFDGCVCDPPYNLDTITDRFGGEGAAPAVTKATGVYARSSQGFMGEAWDSDVAFQVETWRAVYEVMKPGAFVLAFGATRTYHRMATAIEASGFVVLDMVQWQYGSGFPKSHPVDKAALRSGKPGLAEMFEGFGTALKPAQEPVCLAMRPRRGSVLKNFLRYGTGVFNIRDCMIGDARRYPANVIHDASEDAIAGYPGQRGQRGHLTGGEPSAKTKTVFGQIARRFASIPKDEPGSAARFFFSGKAKQSERVARCDACGHRQMGGRGEHCGQPLTFHATVKPVDVMRYLIRLITPLDSARILDPFAGTGTTGIAAMREGVDCTLIDIDPRHIEDIRYRVALEAAE